MLSAQFCLTLSVFVSTVSSNRFWDFKGNLSGISGEIRLGGFCRHHERIAMASKHIRDVTGHRKLEDTPESHQGVCSEMVLLH